MLCYCLSVSACIIENRLGLIDYTCFSIWQIIRRSNDTWLNSTSLECNLFEHSARENFPISFKGNFRQDHRNFRRIPEVYCHWRHFEKSMSIEGLRWFSWLIKVSEVLTSVGLVFISWHKSSRLPITSRVSVSTKQKYSSSSPGLDETKLLSPRTWKHWNRDIALKSDPLVLSVKTLVSQKYVTFVKRKIFFLQIKCKTM